MRKSTRRISNQFLVENKVRVCGLGANDGDIEKFFVEKLSGGQAV